MSLQFGRLVAVQLGAGSGEGVEYSELRVSFRVEMDDEGAPNKAKIEIYNPKKTALSKLQEEGAFIRLLVGYRSNGSALRMIFQGNPISGGARFDYRGDDHVLVVEAQDGGNSYAVAHVSEGFATATTSGQVFDTLAKALGLPLGNIDAVVSDVDFPHGIVLTGPVRDQLDRIAEISGARWTIRDGALQVYELGGTTGENALLFSSANGNLIGRPTSTSEGIKLKALISPSMRPGRLLRVESEDVVGDYVARSVEFRGDSGFGSEFYVLIEADRLG